MSWTSEWVGSAACSSQDPDDLFVQGAEQNRAKLLCLSCRVRAECLADALDHQVQFGVWGGMTERERRALLRRRPNIRSWRDVVEIVSQDIDGLPPVDLPVIVDRVAATMTIDLRDVAAPLSSAVH